ncbi:MAG TPA: hypothetical protein VK056_00225 [Bacillota bacterium]|nr:hypothetical protein [Bacillota bacterium]
MAVIPQMNLFPWEEVEDLGDLDRLRLVIQYLPDEKLMRKLESNRKNGRNDDPVRAVWNNMQGCRSMWSQAGHSYSIKRKPQAFHAYLSI